MNNQKISTLKLFFSIIGILLEATWPLSLVLLVSFSASLYFYPEGLLHEGHVYVKNIMWPLIYLVIFVAWIIFALVRKLRRLR